jgi:hypothetical protein
LNSLFTKSRPCKFVLGGYIYFMECKKNRFILLLCLLLLLCACSERIIQPPSSTWNLVPCEYRVEGDDLSVLRIRAQVTDFDSAKAKVHILFWMVKGDTLSQKLTFFPQFREKNAGYTIFTFQRCLPINSVIKSVDLFIKE